MDDGKGGKQENEKITGLNNMLDTGNIRKKKQKSKLITSRSFWQLVLTCGFLCRQVRRRARKLVKKLAS